MGYEWILLFPQVENCAKEEGDNPLSLSSFFAENCDGRSV